MSVFSPPQKTSAAPRPASVRLLQRACACGEKAGHEGECEECKKKRVQRSPGGPGLAAHPSIPASRFEAGGAALPDALCRRLEPQFGASFADVRIHDDASSHAAARDLDAHAFTLGQHIHFAAGRYRPSARAGLHLLAHELTHTIQQRGAPAGTPSRDAIDVDVPDSALEREADRSAASVAAGHGARVQPGSAAGAQRKLQRQQASASSETVTRPIDERSGVRITRTLRNRPCTEEPETRQTPRSQIFYWDRAANAMGMRYTLCSGRVQVSTEGRLDYSEVVRAGENLLDSLRTNPALGADPSTLVQTAIDQARISSTGTVTLTVDGILQAQASGGATVGTTEQRYNVQGVLRVTPNSVSFTLTGGIDVTTTPLSSTDQYRLNLRVGTRWFAINLGYNQIDTSRVGGPSTTQRSITGTAEIPIPDIIPGTSGTTLQPSLTADPDTGRVTPGISFGGRFGGPEKTPRVSCFFCDCPPPARVYSCTPTGTRRVVDQDADKQLQRLLYAYDSEQPADSAAFTGQVSALAGMVVGGYSVTSIHGFASPEASITYNQALGLRRAEHTRTAVASELSAQGHSTTLPPAVGNGELLGESSARPGSEARNSELIRELTARLTPLNDDQRLELLGVDPARRNDPIQRAQALADVQAFIDGRDARGRRLGTRARWERIFPFLRRVEVMLDRPEVAHEEPVPGAGVAGGCSDEDRAYADANMPEVPARQRLPHERCRS